MSKPKRRVSPRTGEVTWQVQIRKKGYPQVSQNFKKYDDAVIYLKTTEVGIMKNEIINPKEATKWTVAEAIDWYIKNPNPHRKLETRKHFQRLHFLQEEFKGFTIQTFTPKILSKWIDKRLEINAKATVYHYYVALKNALVHHAVQHNYSQNIFNLVKCPTTSGQRNRRFSPDETRKVFKTINKRCNTKKKELKLTILFALETCCRIGEMLQLKWGQVNIEKRSIEFLAETTKTRTFRKIPITSVARNILVWVKKHHNPENDKNKRVFCFYHHNEHHLSRQFQIVCEKAEINDIRWHDLRHEAVSRMFERTTMTDIEIASISGHKDITQLSRYAHLREDVLVKKLW